MTMVGAGFPTAAFFVNLAIALGLVALTMVGTLAPPQRDDLHPGEGYR
jgi:hypothetical protein